MTQLIEVQAPLALFAEGISGHYQHIKSSDEFNGSTQFAAQDGQSLDALYLPAELNAEPGAYRVLALQQISQRLYGSFEFTLERALQVTAQPPPQTVHSGLRRSDFSAWYTTYEYPGLIAGLFRVFERYRLDRRMLADYPGMRKHYRSYFLGTDRADAALEPQDGLEELRELARALALEDAAQIEQRAFNASFALLETDAPDVHDSALAAHMAYAQLREQWLASGMDSQAPEDVTEDWLQRDVRLQDWEEEAAELNQQLMAAQVMQEAEVDAMDAEDLDGQLRDDKAQLKALIERKDNLTRRADMERSAIRHALGADHTNAKSYLYDEWNYLEHRYLPSHCRLYVERLQAEADVDLQESTRVVQRWRNQVKAQLAHIKPLGLQRLNRIDDGDEFDFNALLQARLDLRMGLAPDERIYSRREPVRRDLGVVFLVDLSASTDDPLEPPEPEPWDDDEDFPVNLRDPFGDAAAPLVPDEPTRRIIDVQRDAMLVMAAALESLGDDYAIYGFSGYGHDCVELYVAKELGEAFGQPTLGRIAAMQPKRSTRMGPAIRHSTMRLAASGYAQKLLLVLSDGFPQDCDYGPDRGNHEYGVQDTAKALEEAAAKGIATFCVTVDRSGHDYLKRMCPANNYMVIDEIEDLPAALSGVYQTLAG